MQTLANKVIPRYNEFANQPQYTNPKVNTGFVSSSQKAVTTSKQTENTRD